MIVCPVEIIFRLRDTSLYCCHVESGDERDAIEIAFSLPLRYLLNR